MSSKSIFTVYGKELLDSLRDRRTLIATLVIPTVAMPLIMILAFLVTAKVIKKAQSEAAPVMVIGGGDSPAAMALFKDNPKIACVPEKAGWRQLISNKEIRAAIEIPAGFDAALESGREARVLLYHYEGEMRSGFAVGELRRVLAEYRDQVSSRRLAARGLPQTLIKPFEISSQNVAPPEKVGGNAIGGFIPYMFIILCFTGALYPAIDLTAGEKERGTMETILCSPVSRIDLVMGKFLMVLTAALATVVCSVCSMGGSFIVGGMLFASNFKGAAGFPGQAGSVPVIIDPVGLVGVVILMLPLACFFAALLMAISLAARSTKEAQSTATPLVMVIVLPAMFALLPGVELNLSLSLVPILNMALACKEMLSGVWNWHYLVLIFLSSCAYAAAALAFCVRQFNREDVIFRS
ncbi:MAG: ABC transporter permease [Opitutaceae bacterium]|jgi:sodium transport system permease protein